jgi:hypothetical protein
MWKKNNNGYVQTNSLVPYHKIRSRSNYSTSVFYDKSSVSAYINDSITKTITWFEDENTLGEKYNYVLESGLGGVGIYSINFDGQYQELKNELLYRFTKIDTFTLATTINATNLSFFEKIKGRLRLYSYILNNPCAVCFEISSDHLKIDSYLRSLKTDSLIVAKKAKVSLLGIIEQQHNVWAKKRSKEVEEFDYWNDELNNVLLYTSLIFLLMTLIASTIYYMQVKNNGDDWRWKKLNAAILIVLINFLILSSFTYFFTNDAIPLFGVSNTTQASCGSYDVNCINMPLPTLMLLILIGIGIGFLIFRYLITPLIRSNDIP